MINKLQLKYIKFPKIIYRKFTKNESRELLSNGKGILGFSMKSEDPPSFPRRRRKYTNELFDPQMKKSY